MRIEHWIYTVPFVQRWHVFEMPVLGYLGYLPFGLECGLAAALIAGVEADRPAINGTARVGEPAGRVVPEVDLPARYRSR